MKYCLIVTSIIASFVAIYCWFWLQKQAKSRDGRWVECPISGNFTFIDCSSKNLSTLPNIMDDITDIVRHLDVSCNEINTLTEQLWPNIVHLNLSQNLLTTIEERAFQGMGNLIQLDLSDNLLSGMNMDDDPFAGLKHLEVLILRGNPIVNLVSSFDTFVELTSLKYLDLSFARISTIHKNAFAKLQNIKQISLRGNLLSEADLYAFKPTKRLNELDISENPIKKINRNAFHHLLYLKKLMMESCQLREIGDKTFQGLDSLQYLSLRNNSLKTISTEVLLPMWNLEELVLDENPIQVIDGSVFREKSVSQLNWPIKRLRLRSMPYLHSIESKAFAHLSNLEEISIQNNSQLKLVSRSAFSSDHQGIRRVQLDNNALSVLSKNLLSWDELEYISLTGNRWYCGCRWKWVVSNKIFKSKSSPIICNGPSKLVGRNLFDLSLEDLGCFKRIMEDEGLSLWYSLGFPVSIKATIHIVLMTVLSLGFMIMFGVVFVGFTGYGITESGALLGGGRSSGANDLPWTRQKKTEEKAKRTKNKKTENKNKKVKGKRKE